MGVSPEAFISKMEQLLGYKYKFGGELTGSSPGNCDCCLVAGSMVHTDRGPIPIESVVPGDIVQSFDEGRLVSRKVVGWQDSGEQEAFSVVCQNRTVTASANHPFLRARFDEYIKGRGQGQPPNFEWVRLDELQKGDWLVSCLHHQFDEPDPTMLSDGTIIDTDVAWLIGLFLADGSIAVNPTRTRANAVSWCNYGEDRQRVHEIVAKVWGEKIANTGRDSDSHGVTFSNADFCSLWLELFEGRTSRTKTVPQIILDSSPAIWLAFLDGHAAGDGHTDKRGYLAVHMANEFLARQLRAMRVMLGQRVSNVRIQKRTKPISIKGVAVKDAADLWSFETYPGIEVGHATRMKWRGHYGLSDPTLGYERVLRIKSVGIRPTYDIEVEGAHNFVSDGIVVHNSEGSEWAARNTNVSPKLPDGSAYQFDHCDKNGGRITLEEARNTPGSLIFKSYSNEYPPGDRNNGGIYHIAVVKSYNQTMEVCCDDGQTIKHMEISGRSWYKYGGLVPGVDYGITGSGGDPEPYDNNANFHRNLYWKNEPSNDTYNMRKGEDVKWVQQKVGAGSDGHFGSGTDEKVRAWQAAHGIEADGNVGSGTAAAMGMPGAGGSGGGTTPPPTTTPFPLPSGHWYGYGSTSSKEHGGFDGNSADKSNIKKIQGLVGTTADGLFGKNTEKSVKSWQSANGLSADGDFGEKSWKKAFG